MCEIKFDLIALSHNKLSRATKTLVSGLPKKLKEFISQQKSAIRPCMQYTDHPEAISLPLHGLALVHVSGDAVDVDTGQAVAFIQLFKKENWTRYSKYLVSIISQKGCRSPSELEPLTAVE